MKRILGIGLLVVFGCSTIEPSPADVVRRDSAGVRITQSTAPAWKPGAEWRLDTVPSLEMGDKGEDERLRFSQVSGVQRLSNGTIVVANGSTHQLRFYDSAGTYLNAGARKGRGPGEFSWLGALYRCADTLVANDINQKRVMLFDARGKFIRIVATVGPTGQHAEIHGVSEDCSRLAVVTRTTISREKESDRIDRWPHTVWWTATNASAYDSVTTVPGTRVTIPRLPWGGEPVFAPAGNRVYVGIADDFEIRAFDLKGALREIIRVELPPESITDAHRNEYARFRAEAIREEPRERQLFEIVERSPLPNHRPWFTELLVADDGTLWLRESAVIDGGYRTRFSSKPGAPSVAWYVIDGGGQLLGKVSVPAAFTVTSISQGMIYGVYHDEDDVELVRGYRILRAPN